MKRGPKPGTPATHGHCIRGRPSPTYHSWRGMRKRCNDPNQWNYQYYGALGVRVCDRWERFANFLEDMGPRPTGKTIDRIDPFGDYDPDNCRWADQLTTQQWNKRANVARPDFSSIGL